jgi:hypothetical protein
MNLNNRLRTWWMICVANEWRGRRELTTFMHYNSFPLQSPLQRWIASLVHEMTCWNNVSYNALTLFALMLPILWFQFPFYFCVICSGFAGDVVVRVGSHDNISIYTMSAAVKLTAIFAYLICFHVPLHVGWPLTRHREYCVPGFVRNSIFIYIGTPLFIRRHSCLLWAKYYYSGRVSSVGIATGWTAGILFQAGSAGFFSFA